MRHHVHEPIRVQRRASNTGVIMVVGQKIALGRIHKHQTVTVLVSETTLAVEFADGDSGSSAAPPPNRCVTCIRTVSPIAAAGAALSAHLTT